MLLGDELTPVSKLSGEFLSPASAAHLQFAYFESALVVKYFVEKYGRDKLERVLVDLSVGMPINESLSRYTGSLAVLDAEFAKYARDYANALAPKADWATPELPRRATSDVISAYLQDHPNNYLALQRLAAAQFTAKDWAAAKTTLAKMIELFPEDGSGSGPYAALARIHREEKNTQAERATLVKLAGLTANDLDGLLRLCELAAEAGEWEETKNYALRAIAVNPLLPTVHRYAAKAAESLKDHVFAAASYRALLMLEPFDTAELHFQLATALLKQGKLPEAKYHALLALEETPRYRDAQKLLLELAAVAPALPSAAVPAPAVAPPSAGK